MKGLTVKEASRLLDARLPLAWAESWDNPGLQVGDPDAKVSSVALALDPITANVLRASIEKCELLITHHPAIFKPFSRLITSNPEALAVSWAIKTGTALYAAHTNWDSAPDGVNVILARELGLKKIEPLVPSKSGAWGLGAIGSLPKAVQMEDFCYNLYQTWGTNAFMLYGDPDIKLRRVALCGGSGGDLIDRAWEAGAQLFITADLGHHEILHAMGLSLNLVQFNHAWMEERSLPALADLVREVLGCPVLLLTDKADEEREEDEDDEDEEDEDEIVYIED